MASSREEGLLCGEMNYRAHAFAHSYTYALRLESWTYVSYRTHKHLWVAYSHLPHLHGVMACSTVVGSTQFWTASGKGFCAILSPTLKVVFAACMTREVEMQGCGVPWI